MKLPSLCCSAVTLGEYAKSIAEPPLKPHPSPRHSHDKNECFIYARIGMDHVSRIDLNLLVVLEAIHGQGGVSNAGQKLNLTQPAISHALARPRSFFHDPLFVRDGRTLAPTPFT